MQRPRDVVGGESDDHSFACSAGRKTRVVQSCTSVNVDRVNALVVEFGDRLRLKLCTVGGRIELSKKWIELRGIRASGLNRGASRRR